jgi:ATP-dependent DNA helicase PIF1
MEFQLTEEQQKVFDAVEQTNNNILIQGKPGVGKSVLIRALVEQGRKSYTLAAPTGLAALNIGGKTLHSLFRLPISGGIITPDFNLFNKDDRSVMNLKYNVKHLIIDEVSMVRADTLDFIDRMLREVKGYDEPFGGVQIIIVGDFFQLPPIADRKEDKDLKANGWDTPFAFSAQCFREGFQVFELSTVLRQKGDNTFINLLDSARIGELDKGELDLLNDCVGASDGLRITLTSRNADADNVNQYKLSRIEAEEKVFHAQKYGEWPALPADPQLKLRVGAQVMVKMNAADRPPEHKGDFNSRVVNGTLGVVQKIEDTTVTILTESDEIVKIYVKRWERKIKELQGTMWTERVVASYEQIPLALAWAISIHKSQGQSFERVHINPNKIFAAGQLYVALSRVRSLSGLSLESRVTAKNFWCNQDVLDFFNLQTL